MVMVSPALPLVGVNEEIVGAVLTAYTGNAVANSESVTRQTDDSKATNRDMKSDSPLSDI